MGSSLRICFFLDDQLCIRRVIQRDEGGLAQSLLAADNEATVLQLPENLRGALAAMVEFDLCLLSCEVQPDDALLLGIAVLPGDAGSVQQKCIEHFRVAADVTQGPVLKQKPWKRHIGRCRTAGGKLTECFHHFLSHLVCIDWIDRSVLLRVDFFLID